MRHRTHFCRRRAYIILLNGFRSVKTGLSCEIWIVFYHAGNIVKNLQGRYDGITRKSTAECTIAEGGFLVQKADASDIFIIDNLYQYGDHFIEFKVL